MLRRENFVKNLHHLTGDMRRACEELAAAAVAPSAPGHDDDPAASAWRVMDPFDSLYRAVYQLTMRTVGADEIAEDPALLRRTLALFEGFERSSSTAKVVFPWFPAPNHLYRLYTGARLAVVFQRIIDARGRSGTRRDDALQFLIDQGASIRDIIAVSYAPLSRCLPTFPTSPCWKEPPDFGLK